MSWARRYELDPRPNPGSETGPDPLSDEDNGSGVDERTVEQVFDPFFTSCRTKGYGLGLYQVYTLTL